MGLMRGTKTKMGHIKVFPAQLCKKSFYTWLNAHEKVQKLGNVVQVLGKNEIQSHISSMHL